MSEKVIREAKLKTCDQIKRTLWQLFDSGIDVGTPVMVQDLPFRPKYIIGFLVLISYIVFFVSFCVTGYIQQIDTKYLVPVDQETPSATCTDALRTITASYMIDINGTYSGVQGFDYNEALYNLELNNLQVTNSQYQSLIQGVKEEIAFIGQQSKNETLNINLVFWFSFKYVFKYSDNPNLQQFSFVSDINIVFNSLNSVPVSFYMQSTYAHCNISRYASFEPSSYALSVQFDALKYNDTKDCTSIIGLDNLNVGYNALDIDLYPALNQVTKTNIDLRSYFTALAINLNLFSPKFCAGDIRNCLQITGYANASNNPSGLETFYLIDPRYYGMAPVGCLNTSAPNQFMCVVQFGGLFGIPVFNTIGTGSDSIQQEDFFSRSICECSSVDQNDPGCTDFSFFVSLIVFSEQNVGASISLLLKYNGNYQQLIKDAFQATVPSNTRKDTEEFSFCVLQEYDTECEVVTFLVSNNDGTNPISQYYKDLIQGGCTDNFNVPDSVWDKIEEGLPISFVENYKQCHKKGPVAFFDAAGIAAANMNILVPFVALFLVQAYLLFNLYTLESKSNNNNHPRNKMSDERKFKKHAKSEALGMLAQLILEELHRRKYGTSDNNDLKSEIINDVADLIQDRMGYEHMNSAIYMSDFVKEFGYLSNESDKTSVKSALHHSKSRKEDEVDIEMLPSTVTNGLNDHSKQQSTVVPGFRQGDAQNHRTAREEKVKEQENERNDI